MNVFTNEDVCQKIFKFIPVFVTHWRGTRINNKISLDFFKSNGKLFSNTLFLKNFIPNPICMF